jgi:hypothetical protein
MRIFLAALLLLQEKPVSQSSLPEKTRAALKKVLSALDSSDITDRESARRELRRLSDSYGEPIILLAQEQTRGSSPEVKSSVEDLVTFRRRVEQARKVVAAYNALDTPDLTGKKFIVYNTGGYSVGGGALEYYYTYGWLLEESTDTILIADESPECVTITRRKELPKGWDPIRDKHPKDAPLPGFYKEVDFELFCGDLLKNGIAPSDRPYASREAAHLVNEAVYTYWAFKRGMNDLGLALLAQTQRTFEGPHNDWVKSKQTLTQLINASLVQHLRANALSAARGGEIRPRLLERWRLIANRLPEDEYPGEAKEMCRLYQKLIDEDGAWVELKKEDIAHLSIQKKAEYWMYKLRELAASQSSDPGTCNVLQGPFGGQKGEETDPAHQLVRLGRSALPLIIEHLDDPSPTRSMGWHRIFIPATYYLLRYGDCCQQIFEAITGFGIWTQSSTNGYPISDGLAVVAKKKAEKWFSEQGGNDVEGYFAPLLSNGSCEQQILSAKTLIPLNQQKYLPIALQVLKGKDSLAKATILSIIESHLGDEHRDLLLRLLGDRDRDLVVEVARLLWRKDRIPEGARAVMAQLRAITPDEDASSLSSIAGGIQMLSEVETPWVYEGLCDLMVHPSKRMRNYAIEESWRFRDPLIATALVRMLDDTGEGRLPGLLRYCDEAATALARLVGFEKTSPGASSQVERDQFISEVRLWWSIHRKDLDWAELRRK